MANTVHILSYANTFGDWVVSTNALAKENNDIAANNYTKPTGTLYLNDPVLGLQVANNAVVAGQLQVQGTGSSAYIQNNARVDGQVYLTNTILSIVTSGQANIGGPLLALGSGTGLSVSNNAAVAGNIYVGGNETVVGNLNVTGATGLNNILTVNNTSSFTNTFTTGTVTSNNLTANTLVTTPTLTVTGYASVAGQLSVGGNFVINGSTVNNSNTFTINANSNVGLISTYNVNRGSSGANASIRWNESNHYWDILDVSPGGVYSKILTANLISDSVATVNSATIASSTAANTLNNSITLVNNTLTSYLISNVATINSNISSNVATINSNITSNVNTLNSNISSNVALLTSWVNAANTNASNASYISNGTLSANRLPLSGVTAGTYGGSDAFPVLTIDATGRVTVAGNVTPSIPTSQLTGTISSSQLASGAAVTNIGYTPYNATNPSGYISGINSGMVTSALGYTPYNATNPAGYITSSASISGTATNITQFTINQNLGTGNDVQHNSLGLGTAPQGGGSIFATGNITAYYSDDRLKTRLGVIENALDKVMSLTGFYYQANQTAQDLGYTAKREVGVSAQDVQNVLPEIVSPAPIDSKYLTIDYERLVPLLIEAIKELKSEIEDLKKS